MEKEKESNTQELNFRDKLHLFFSKFPSYSGSSEIKRIISGKQLKPNLGVQ